MLNLVSVIRWGCVDSMPVSEARKELKPEASHLVIVDDALTNLWHYFVREPVTTEEAEDYFEVISSPMDFQTMQSKCSCGSYRSVQDFLSDMKQVFSNAEQYNQNGSHVLTCLEKTEQCLIDMLHKHLPGHTYMRRKRKRSLVQPGQEFGEADGDSDPEALEYTRGRRRRK